MEKSSTTAYTLLLFCILTFLLTQHLLSLKAAVHNPKETELEILQLSETLPLKIRVEAHTFNNNNKTTNNNNNANKEQSPFSSVWTSPLETKKVFSIIADVDELFAFHQVTNFIIYSSLLGSRLHNSYLPWDPVNYFAVDEQQFQAKYEQIEKVASTRNLTIEQIDNRHYIVFHNTTTAKQKIPFIVKLSTYKLLENSKYLEFDSFLFETDDILHLNNIAITSRRSLHGFMVSAPHSPEKVLETIYSPFWKSDCVWHSHMQSFALVPNFTTSKGIKSDCRAIAQEFGYNFNFRRPVTSRIEHSIHQLWIGNKTAPTTMINSCTIVNENLKHTTWNDSNLPFPSSETGLQMELSKAYNLSKTLYGKSDILRLELLYQQGGIWIDADNYCLRPVEELLEHEVDFFIGYHFYKNYESGKHKGEEKEELLATSVLGSTKGHPLLRAMIDELKTNPKKVEKTAPWVATGPVLVTNWLAKFVHNADYRIGIYPFYYFVPHHHNEKMSEAESNKIKLYKSYNTNVFGSTFKFDFATFGKNKTTETNGTDTTISDAKRATISTPINLFHQLGKNKGKNKNH